MSTPVTDPSQPVDYESATVPTSYTCSKCGKTGVKLWRDYQTFLENQTLFCADCSGKEQEKDVSEITDDGNTPHVVHKLEVGSHTSWSNSIGWRVPAIPTTENNAFWSYGALPPDGLGWWQRLPNR
jgi:DNA-directed RNA polymerase subunit RPC12/RpoP